VAEAAVDDVDFADLQRITLRHGDKLTQRLQRARDTITHEEPALT